MITVNSINLTRFIAAYGRYMSGSPDPKPGEPVWITPTDDHFVLRMTQVAFDRVKDHLATSYVEYDGHIYQTIVGNVKATSGCDGGEAVVGYCIQQGGIFTGAVFGLYSGMIDFANASQLQCVSFDQVTLEIMDLLDDE